MAARPLPRTRSVAYRARVTPADLYGFATGVVALIIVAFPLTWTLVGPLITAVHEAGHAIMALLSGRKVLKIKIVTAQSGGTYLDRDGNVLIGLAGYTFPPLTGFGAAHAVTAGYSDLVLWGVVIALGVGLLLKIRNVFGFVAIAMTAVVFWLLASRAAPEARQGLAYVLAWVLMLGGVRDAFGIHGEHMDGHGDGSDADKLQAMTGLPAMVWTLLMAGAGCYALYSGAVLMIPSWAP